MNLRSLTTRPRLGQLLGLALFCLCLWGFFELAEDFPEGEFQARDAQILRAFRHADDLGQTRGPAWLLEVVRDISALGSPLVLGLLVLAVLGYIALKRDRALFLAVAGSTLGGVALANVLKWIAHRERPSVVPHLTTVSSASFPSGHSMMSAVVFLTLATLLGRREKSPALRIYLLALAAFLSLGVGVSRVFLGVHYPTDVLAGWFAGLAWAIVCAAVFGWGREKE